MGYLANDGAVQLQAIITKKGRELLSKGRDQFNITQFALSDDEIDYNNWNERHPRGTDFYGIIIENMPITEPVPDETQNLKSKLITLPKNTVRMPVISVQSTSITLNAEGETAFISPETINYENGNSSLGYTAILSDSDAATIIAEPGTSNATNPRYIGDGELSQSVYVSGARFIVTAKKQPLADKLATITIIGNETGGRKTINLTVKKQTVATATRDISS